MRTYDFNRGLATLIGAAIAGGLIWVAGMYIDDKTTGGYWAVYGIIAGAGPVMALSQLVGGWTKFGMPRLSLVTLLLGFLPVPVGVGWLAYAPADSGLVGAGQRRTVEIREGGAPMAPRPDPEQNPERMD